MPDVEAPAFLSLEVHDVIGNARLDHCPHVASCGRCGNGRRGADRAAKETGAAGVGGKDPQFMPKALERVAKFQRMHDPAARISRMGENGDAQGSAHAKTSTLA